MPEKPPTGRGSPQPRVPPVSAVRTLQETDLDEVPAETPTTPYRPTRRPPMPVLTLLEDGSDEGFDYPVLKSPFVIGRTDGDLRVNQDRLMSKRHASLVQRLVGDEVYWFLEDLSSRNGVYVRISQINLGRNSELVLGSRKYRLYLDEQADEPNKASLDDRREAVGETLDLESDDDSRAAARLVEIGPASQGWSQDLDRRDHWIGRNAALCSVVLDDPTVNPRHALLRPVDDTKWELTDAKSLNGVWVRFGSLRLSRARRCQFQLGEQRFVLRIP